MCDQLKVSQITKILNLYTPADEYEERVSPAFVRKIQAKLNQRAIAENQDQVSQHRVRYLVFLRFTLKWSSIL
jgi:myosin-5